MATKVFINLPVKNLDKSMDFFKQLGFVFNPQFTDEKAACMVISESIFVMLLMENYFQTFTRKEISDAKKATEVIVTLDANSKDEVRELISKAESSGAHIYAEAQDYGWMYQHGFADLDGHQWELAYMNLTQIPNQ